ncbi:cysteine hydrolase family protein [Tenacibaculum dicentrarchi]|uniref:cysteine hydrolase family protein n=1 Tax=Tenacibaculum dicentrarchi TaxID=669041 RepID=UPI000CAE96FF|nr:Uncharacterized isochorismatase family protein YddQ [Tenacibaculum dicentrarchi]
MKKIITVLFLGINILNLTAQMKEMKTALILIDIQNDYFKGGKMELHNPEKAGDNAKKILEYSRKKNKTIVHIKHISSRPNSTFFIPKTFGVKINERVKPLDNEKVIIKHYPNSFVETELLTYLKSQKIEKVIICGMMTHMCVDATTRASKDHGFECIVIGDACATKNLQINNEIVNANNVQKSFLGALNYYYSSVITTKEFLSK